MSSDFRKQVYNNLNLKDTDELVEIWKRNDHVEWTETTFSVIQEILQERLDELPPQGEPIIEYVDDDDNDVDESEDKTDFDFIIDGADLPEFYNPYEVLRLETWLHHAAIVAIIASIIYNLLGLQQMQRTVLGFFNNNEMNFVAWLIAIVIYVFAAGLQCILIYFPLKALGSILRILMEMEFNSRGVLKVKNI